jgi:hypothetical protein
MIVLYKEKIMEEQFKAAAVKSKSLPAQSNDNLLALYALYKQILSLPIRSISNTSC